MIVNVQSAGGDHGNFARITLNDTEFGFETYSRGLNVAVMDEVTGQQIYCTTFDTCIDPTASTAFTEFIERLPEGRIVAIAVKDDATVYLDDRAKYACTTLGGYLIYYLPFRGSWAMIGQKGATPGTAAESVSDTSAVSCSREFNLPGIPDPGATLGATSGGGDQSNLTQINLNGEEIALKGGYQRGLNVVVYDPTTGKPRLKQSFDIFADPTQADAFAQSIEDLANGEIVAIAVQDDATFNLSDRAKRACQSIGSTLIERLPFRSSWAMIGYKGAAAGSAIENWSESRPVSLKAWICALVSSSHSWQQTQKLQPSDLQRQHIFGSSVAINQTTAIVGARLADTHHNPYAGSIYTFQLENGHWQQKQKLQPTDLHRGNCFGNAVAISGDAAIVGAYFADAEAGQYAGSAYIFQLDNGEWRQKQKLQPNDLQRGDNFGYAVAISGDVAIVGAHLASAAGVQYAGSAYIFHLDNGEWTPKQKLQPNDLQCGDNFGTSVAISGNMAVIGARLATGEGGQYAGSVYVFQLDNGEWIQTQKLQPPDLQRGDNFGNAVAINGDLLIIGAYGVDREGCADVGSAYIFQWENGEWRQQQKLQPGDLQRGDGFGTSVDINQDLAIVGAYGVDRAGCPDAGSTYIFRRENGEWRQQQKLQPADLQRGDGFGYAVALNQNVAIIGAYNADAEGGRYAGSAYIFEPGMN